MQYYANPASGKIVKIQEQPGRTTTTLTDERSHQTRTHPQSAAYYIQILRQRGYHPIDAGKYAALRADLSAQHRENLPTELHRQLYAQFAAA